MNLRRTLFTLCLLLVPAAAREAQADPVHITSGTYFLSNTNYTGSPRYVSYSADLQGDGFRARASVADGGSRAISTTCVSPCGRGSSFSINFNETLATQAPLGSLVIGGQNYLGRFTNTSLFFTTSSITVPADAPMDPNVRLTLMATFTMSGTVGFTAYDFNTGVISPDIYSGQVSGSGVAVIEVYYGRAEQQFHAGSMRLYFTDANTPEPATLALLGTGLAGLAAARKRRRKLKG